VMKVENKIVHYKEIMDCWHPRFQPGSKRKAYCYTAQLEPN
jgi:hypothetical protein